MSSHLAFVVAVIPLVTSTVVVHVGGSSHVRSHGEITECLRVLLGIPAHFPFGIPTLALVLLPSSSLIVILVIVVSVVVLAVVVTLIVPTILLIRVVGIGIIITTVMQLAETHKVTEY